MISRWRVFFGFLSALLYLWLARVDSWCVAAAGLLLSLAGLCLRGWAAGYLEKGKRLAQDGPYAWVRHPLYTGSFLMALGFVLAGTSASKPVHAALLWVVFLVLFVGIYPARIKEEEMTLESHFGDAWRAFTQANHRFLPRLTPARRENPESFLWQRYKKNTEFNAAWGWLIGVAVVCLKGKFGW